MVGDIPELNVSVLHLLTLLSTVVTPSRTPVPGRLIINFMTETVQNGHPDGHNDQIPQAPERVAHLLVLACFEHITVINLQ